MTNISVSTPDGFSGTISVDGVIISINTQDEGVAEQATFGRKVEVASQTNPNVKYTLLLDTYGEAFSCTCKAFEFSKKFPRTCKHITAFSG